MVLDTVLFADVRLPDLVNNNKTGRGRNTSPCFRFQRKNMSKGDLVEFEGFVVDAMGGGQYSIRLDSGSIVRCQLYGIILRRFK
jgi:hypothetical protein